MGRHTWAWTLLAILATACGGGQGTASDTEGGGSGGTTSAGTDTADPTGGAPAHGCLQAPDLIRRLTRTEYTNTVRDLLGYDDAGVELPPDPITNGFDNNAEALGVTVQLAERHLLTAEKIAEWATTPERLDGLLGCGPDVAAADDAAQEACVRDWLARFGRLALRRPVEPAEIDAFIVTYQRGKLTDFATGIADTLTRLLLSPSFWYRVELGTPMPDEPGVFRLTGHELASRLSYFLWQSGPDAVLLDAAEQGQLETSEQLAAQVDRMLADPRARATVRNMLAQLFETDQIAGFNKVDVSADLGPLMRAETDKFLEHVVWDSQGGLVELLTATYSFVPPALSWIYGLTADAYPPGTDMNGTEPLRVDLDPEQRAGLLTHAGQLAIRAFPAGTRPIIRGKFVRERLLCAVVPPPPPGANNVAPAPDPSKTTREQYEAHASDPLCSGCHETFDDLGFAFEHYDHAGRFRLQELGLPIDASGQIAVPAIGPFDGGVDLAHQLADSDVARRCFVTQVFRFSFGRAEAQDDSCVLDRLDQTFTASETDLLALLRAIASDESFLYRTVGGDS